ncbi:hypothetical protein JOE21_002193 [Desmospora profundinema]|uniref:Uncharacterized protein n=1 Tax=Desmospora profundinema TaxID=1571184 RepID=A0ABU1IN43_9BACL|nr:hypothetical protein [Desmospora profundinema]
MIVYRLLKSLIVRGSGLGHQRKRKAKSTRVCLNIRKARFRVGMAVFVSLQKAHSETRNEVT